jgi:hypothetical protein
VTAHAKRTVPGHLPTMGRLVGFTVHPWELSYFPMKKSLLGG